MDLFDPSKITTWISLSAAALLIVAFMARLVINSEAIKRVTKQNTYLVLKSVINKTFILALIIILAAASITFFNSYINSAMKETAEEMQKSQQLLQEWALLENSDRNTALLSLRSAAERFSSYENYFMYAAALSNAGMHAEAITIYEKAQKIKSTKEVFLNIGSAYQDIGAISKAIEVFKQGLRTPSDSLSSHIFQSKLNFNLAVAHLDIYQAELESTPDPEDLEKAKFYLAEAEIGIGELSEYKGAIYGLKALLSEMTNEYASALDYYKKSLAIRTNEFFGSEEAYDIGKTNNNVSSLLLNEFYEDPEDNRLAIRFAQEFAEEALYVFESGGFKPEAGIAEFNLADAYRKQEKFDLALKYYQRSESSLLNTRYELFLPKVEERIKEMKRLLQN